MSDRPSNAEQTVVASVGLLTVAVHALVVEVRKSNRMRHWPMLGAAAVGAATGVLGAFAFMSMGGKMVETCAVDLVKPIGLVTR